MSIAENETLLGELFHVDIVWKLAKSAFTFGLFMSLLYKISGDKQNLPEWKSFAE